MGLRRREAQRGRDPGLHWRVKRVVLFLRCGIEIANAEQDELQRRRLGFCKTTLVG